MLISSAGKIVYLNKVFEAAAFAPRDVVDEIDRLSRKHGAPTRIMRAPPGGTDEGVIAIWGFATLDPVDQGTRALLANGSTVDVGILVDFLHNARESARRGLPVFRLSGGPGYFWSARIGPDGHGSLRFGMSDVRSFDGPPAATPPTPNVAATRPALVPPAAGPETSDAARGRQDALDRQVADAKRLLDAATAFVKTDTSGPDVLDLVQAISDLNVILGERDLNTINRRAQTLKEALTRNPRFSAFQAERADAVKRRNAQAVSAALQQAQSYRAFLTTTVTADPTSSNVSILLPLIKRLDAAVAKPDAERLDSLNSAVDLAIRQAGLHDAYGVSLAKATAAKTVAADEAATETGAAGAGSQIDRKPAAGSNQVAAMPADPRMTADALTALRAEHRDSAKTSTSKIDDEIKGYVAKPADTALLAQQFPEFTDWLDGETSGGWSLSNETFELADYGVVDWHGRRLPVPMTRVTFHLRNGALGSTKSSCFVFVRIDDAEANATRDPIAVPCNDAAALTRWRTSHAFTSQWNIE